jgi:hypothetical protein
MFIVLFFGGLAVGGTAGFHFFGDKALRRRAKIHAQEKKDLIDAQSIHNLVPRPFF